MTSRMSSMNSGWRRMFSPHGAIGIAAPFMAVVVALQTADVKGQVLPNYERFQPLSQRTSPGVAASWASLAGRAGPLQPVRLAVEGDADVSVFHSPQMRETKLQSPAQISVVVGHCYRLRLSNLPDLPGVELYPTIEVIDRLHAPPGHQDNFPIPIQLTRSDIDLALSGNLVTRVVYLEQPQLAAPFELDGATATQDLTRTDNALSEADRRGRPLVIVRMGARLPSPHGEPLSFYGTGGPIGESQPNLTPRREMDQKLNSREPGP